jgi:UDPglucose 6-dehydrogenase
MLALIMEVMLPKDVQAFQAVAGRRGYDFSLFTEVMRINSGPRHRFVKKVRSALWTLRGKRLAALGLAFKGDTDNISGSPAIEIIEALLREGTTVRVGDPAATEKLPYNGGWKMV